MTVAVNDAIPLYDGKNLYIEQGMENGYYSMKDIIDRCKKIEDDIDIIIIDERFDNVWSYRKNNDENSAGNQYKLVIGKGPENERMVVLFRM